MVYSKQPSIFPTCSFFASQLDYFVAPLDMFPVPVLCTKSTLELNWIDQIQHK